MCKVIGHIRAGGVKRVDILRYMEGIAPGTNRRSHYKSLKKLWRWAYDLDYLLNDPMAKLKPLDEWGVNNEVLTPELFQRFLRVVQGVEPQEKDLKQLSSTRASWLILYWEVYKACERARWSENEQKIL
jgi:hypothetical protein